MLQSVYKDIQVWEATCTIGKNLLRERELNNRHDPFAVAVPDYQIIVGIIVRGQNFMGKKISRFCKNCKKREIYIPMKFYPPKIEHLKVSVTV